MLSVSDTSRPPRNRGPTAATYLTVLGWVDVVSLNLGGLIWIWFAWRIRELSNGFRKAALLLLGLHVLLAGAAATKLLLDASDPPKLYFGGRQLHVRPVVILLAAAAFAVIHLVPMLWLLAPGTRAAFERREARRLCVRCAYDLRESKDVCPECGTPVPPLHATVSDLAERLERMR